MFPVVSVVTDGNDGLGLKLEKLAVKLILPRLKSRRFKN